MLKQIALRGSTLALALVLILPAAGAAWSAEPTQPPSILGADQLANQLVVNLRGRSGLTGRRLAVTPLVDLSDLQTTSDLGRLVAEELASAMHFRRFHLAEIRLDDRVVLARWAGEMVLTRTGPDRAELSRTAELGKLSDRYNLGGIVVGTYAVKDSGSSGFFATSSGQVALNVRLIDPISGAVLAAGSAKVPLDDSVRRLLNRRGTAVSWTETTINQKRF